jgi:hypothetical protein
MTEMALAARQRKHMGDELNITQGQIQLGAERGEEVAAVINTYLTARHDAIINSAEPDILLSAFSVPTPTIPHSASFAQAALERGLRGKEFIARNISSLSMKLHSQSKSIKVELELEEDLPASGTGNSSGRLWTPSLWHYHCEACHKYCEGCNPRPRDSLFGLLANHALDAEQASSDDKATLKDNYQHSESSKHAEHPLEESFEDKGIGQEAYKHGESSQKGTKTHKVEPQVHPTETPTTPRSAATSDFYETMSMTDH